MLQPFLSRIFTAVISIIFFYVLQYGIPDWRILYFSGLSGYGCVGAFEPHSGFTQVKFCVVRECVGSKPSPAGESLRFRGIERPGNSPLESFRALEPSKPVKFAGASDEQYTRQSTSLIIRYFLNQQ
jgi:hypothetical protein